jgi:hypothetical protein
MPYAVVGHTIVSVFKENFNLVRLIIATCLNLGSKEINKEALEIEKRLVKLQ